MKLLKFVSFLLFFCGIVFTADGKEFTNQNLASLVSQLTSGYLSNDELAAHLKDFVKRCNGVSKLHSFGDSKDGFPLLALELSDRPGEDTGKPEVKYVANIHGDEPSGRQLLLLLAERLCSEFPEEGSPAKQLLTSVRLFLIPALNPDGYDKHSRSNSALVDLNRNFPDPVQLSGKDLKQPTGREQPETLAMMKFILEHRFVASLALHEGALVANYPFDGYPDGSLQERHEKSPSPDDAAFVHMAATYAQLHTTMSQSKEFKGGITNGAQWYPLYGGMQDWNYLAGNCLEVTLELNDDKWPTPQRLAQMWTENSQALVVWPLKTVMTGLRGRVVSKDGDAKVKAVAARIDIKENNATIQSSPTHGTFYRVLAPGKYTLTIQADGYKTVTQTVDIGRDGVGSRDGPGLEVQLEPSQAPAPALVPTTKKQSTQSTQADSGNKQDKQGNSKASGEGQTQSQEGHDSSKGQKDKVSGSHDGSSVQEEDGSLDTTAITASMLPWKTESASGVTWFVFIGIPGALLVAYGVYRYKQTRGHGLMFPRPAGYKPVAVKPPETRLAVV